MTLSKIIMVSRLVLPTGQDLSFESLSRAFSESKIEYHNIDHANWVEAPSNIAVRFAIAHSDQYIYVKYEVKEPSIRAFYTKDHECRPFEDSCVEFFVSLDESPAHYYNIESNCIGALQFKSGTSDRNSRVRYGDDITSQIKRYSTLPQDKAIEAQERNVEWSLIMAIPVTLLGRDASSTLSGTEGFANFYKCGDKLPTPHFLSWSAVEIPNPDFHQPNFFGKIIFE